MGSKVARKAKRAEIFKRAEKFAKEYQDQERDEIRLRREARKEGNYYVPGDHPTSSLCASWCTSVVSSRSTATALPSPPTTWSRELLASLASSAWRISSMRFSPLVPTSSTRPTSCGPSS